jgi:flagellin-like protein
MMKSLGGVRMRGRITKFRRHVKALSPIFAVLILIAIAVIAGIIVYMFTSGYLGTMMGGGTAGQEKVAIQAVVVTNSTLGQVTLYAKSTGGGEVLITEAILQSSSGAALDVQTTSLDVPLLADGTLAPVNCDFAVGMQTGYMYSVALVTQAGNQFVSATFKAP